MNSLFNYNISHFTPINIPYGSCLLPSDKDNRQGAPGPSVFGDGKHYTECIPRVVKTPQEIGPQNTRSVNILDTYFMKNIIKPTGAQEFTNVTGHEYHNDFSKPDLQVPRPEQLDKNRYILLAGESLHARPDKTMSVFFSDDNIQHLVNTVVKKVREITADSGVGGTKEGITIQTPNMDDFFYYMVNIFQNYKINNGSICFVGLKNNTSLEEEISKLNTTVLQQYVSGLISQINMYIYYYKDASQIPEQLALPTYTSMKGSKTLEYNTGFTSGNSIAVASYNQVGNII